MNKQWYVGMIKGTPNLAAVLSDSKPEESHGDKLGFFIGPFKTRRGAEYAARVGIQINIKGILEYERLAELELNT
jgi:hypothetical protein